MTTRDERLAEIYRVYNDAWTHHTADLAEAATPAETDAVMQNLRAAETSYLEAAHQSLSETGPAVEQAYDAAKQANDAVTSAREAQQALAERLRLMAKATIRISELIKAAG